MRKFFTRIIINWVLPILSRYPAFVVVLGLIYLISPFDLLPEAFTGFIGYFDDLLAILLSLYAAQKLQKWRTRQPSSSSSESPARDPYQVLEIPRNASADDIKKAYRKKMAEYHPDKVAHLGEELKKTAHKTTLDIQKAYDSLSKLK